MVKGGPHPGDLPNQFASADGTLHASLLSNMFSLGNGKKSLFDRDGASIILHARGRRPIRASPRAIPATASPAA